LKVSHVPMVNPANGKQRLLPSMTEIMFHNLLVRADISVLRCWTSQIMQKRSNGTMILQEFLQQGCPGPDSGWDAGGRMETNTRCFSASYLSQFFSKHWPDFTQSLAKKTQSLAELDKLFDRGAVSTAKLDTKLHRETTTFKHSYYQASLSLLFRIGLSFVKIPGLLQVQPYMQLMIAFDIRQLITAVKARLGMKSTARSKLEEHQERINSCKACVATGQAFCDRSRVAKAMFKPGYDRELDKCVDKTLEQKQRCNQFSREDIEVADDGAGAVFAQETCPCYDSATGELISPEWITTESHCDEMPFPGEEEDLRRATKRTDWARGFHVQTASAHQNWKMLLDNKLDYSGPKGCSVGYRCCGAFVQGIEILRCVHTKSLKSGGFFRSAKCKYFNPADEKVQGQGKVAWGHIRQEFRCAPKDRMHSNFDGHWLKAADNEWVENDEALVIAQTS